MEAVISHYGKDKASVVFKHFPLNFHKDAQLAAEASMAAHEQGKFWEFHDLLFANNKALSRPDLERYAQDLNLDMDKFKAALDGGKFSQRVRQDMIEGQRASVRGTPSIYINGLKYEGPRDPTGMIAAIDQKIFGKKPAAKAADAQPQPTADAAAKPATAEEAQAGPSGTKGIEHCLIKGPEHAKVTVVEYTDYQ